MTDERWTLPDDLWEEPAAPLRRDARAATSAGLPAATPVERAPLKDPIVHRGRLIAGFAAVVVIGVMATAGGLMASDAEPSLTASAPGNSGVLSLLAEGGSRTTPGETAQGQTDAEDASASNDAGYGPSEANPSDPAAPDAAHGDGATAGDAGSSSPGSEVPGALNPGTSSPGTSTPGASNPGASNPGTSNPGTSTPGTSNPGTSQPAPGPSQPVPVPSQPAPVPSQPAPVPSQPAPSPSTPPKPSPPKPSPPKPAAPKALAFGGLSKNYVIGLLGIRLLSNYTLPLPGQPGSTASVTYGSRSAGSVRFDGNGRATITIGGALLDLGLSNPLVRVAYSDGTAGAAIEARRDSI